jgi:NAD-dependent dihydropyrimidine dehydrogenase PreA subunit
MAHVITSRCIDVKDLACVKCCPVDCIYQGERTLYIHPDECIDCGVCVSACPREAIYDERNVPGDERGFIAVNREFFAPAVTGLGSPGGAECAGPQALDHPWISQLRGCAPV